MTRSTNGTAWIRWIVGGGIAAFLLSVSVAWALVGNYSTAHGREFQQLSGEVHEYRADISDIKASLARIEGRLDIEER